MQIAKNYVVEFDYTLKNNDGEMLDTSQGKAPLAYLHGSKNIIPGLEKELEGKKEGDQFKISIPPAEGYGERNEQMVTSVPRSDLSQVPDIDVGMQLQAQTPQGVQVFTIVELDDENVTLDANHPLAGVTLNFDIKVVAVREATTEEIEHGHVHSPGGHHH